MSFSLEKIWKENSVGVVVILLVVAFAANYFSNYLSSKGKFSPEFMTDNTNAAYNNTAGAKQPSNVPQPAEDMNQNEVYSPVNGISTTSQGLTQASQSGVQNSSDLLPKDNNNQWAQLNPSGKGDLANINLLKAGYHIGIDTIGQSLRNANLQIRSEPPNPQLYVGPWNNSTITSDFMRVPLEIGSGAQ
jgi:hypothetical protein